MQHIRIALRRWLGASVFAAASLFATGAHADGADPEPAGVIDDAMSTVGQYYAILCNTCASTTDYVNKAVTQYPRVRDSTVYVYNLASKQIRTIAIYPRDSSIDRRDERARIEVPQQFLQ